MEGLMANSESSEAQIYRLIETYKEAKKELKETKHTLKKSQADLAVANARILELEANYRRLKLAKAYGWNEESKRQATDTITKLVRDIDDCLAMLD